MEMTREEAWRKAKGYLYDALDGKEADEIIKALEQEPCEDCISKQAVLDIAKTVETEDFSGNELELIKVVDVDDVKDLPPVTPQPKMGRWIIIDDCEQFIAKCSECGRIEDSRMISKYPYCHCGVKMEGKVQE